jgi:hypothetical protein
MSFREKIRRAMGQTSDAVEEAAKGALPKLSSGAKAARKAASSATQTTKPIIQRTSRSVVTTTSETVKRAAPKVRQAAQATAETAGDVAQVAGPKIAKGAHAVGDVAKAAGPKAAAAGKYAYDNPDAVAKSLAGVAAVAAVFPGGQPLAAGSLVAAGAAQLVADAKDGKLEAPKKGPKPAATPKGK